MITTQSILELVLVAIQLCVGILNVINLIRSIAYKHKKKKHEQGGS